jgi:multidrug resistance efflux pump
MDDTAKQVEQAKRALETAETELRSAAAAHEVEAKRLEMASSAAWELDEELSRVDPDGDAFDRLVAGKAKAGAKVEALAAREAKARLSLESARAGAAEARIEHARAEVAQANATIATKEAALDGAVRELVTRLVAGVRELGPLVAARDGLEERLPLDPGLPYHIHRRHRWNLAAVGHITLESVMRAAMGVTLS